ncbi:MAG: hypothetical protein RBT56_05660 [Ignavibacteriaceae bacterium]|jgi:hypothetical protein|nr:hypothetical protein [Ignavibacteriaceae bacterium]GIK23175.1 MAG: hypothetical protein BroJett005_25890 [Ignavibacteriota bacterium]
MKKLILVFLLAINTIVFAQNINGRFSSSVYTFERYDSLNSSENYVRAYEMLNLNLNYDKFSIRSFLNFETDLTKEQISDPRLRFYNLYLEARDLLNIATVKIGRQPIINNVVGGLFDGGSIILKHTDYKLNAFYGGNVPAYQKLEITNDFKNNFILGGKFTTTVIPNSQLSIGYVNKNFKPENYFTNRLDPNLNLIEVEIENKSNQYQFVTGELNYTMPEIVQTFFRYDYDINFKQTSRFEFDARTEAVKNLGLNVYYNFREPKIRYNSIFSVFDYGNTHEIEVGADYKINQMITVIGKFGNVQYKDENSQRVAIGLSTSYGSVNYRKTFGYAGELDAISLYSGYTLFDGLLTPSVGLSYTNYKLSPEAESNSVTSLLVGTNIRPFRVLSFDLQGQYMDNKIYKNDLRLFFKLNYWFNLNI